MKKLVVGLLVSLFVITVFNSCKVKKDCPAYGKNNSEQLEQNA